MLLLKISLDWFVGDSLCEVGVVDEREGINGGEDGGRCSSLLNSIPCGNEFCLS